jgi:hypothetical protein
MLVHLFYYNLCVYIFFRNVSVSVVASDTIKNRFMFYPKRIPSQTDLNVVTRDLLPSKYLKEKFKECKTMDCGFWLIDITGQNMDTVGDDLSEMPMDIDDEVFLAQEVDGTVFLYESYKIGELEHATILSYGNWSREAGLSVSTQDIWQRRSNFQVKPNQLAWLLIKETFNENLELHSKCV